MGSKLLQGSSFEEHDSLVPGSDQRTGISHDSTHSEDRPPVSSRRLGFAMLVVASGLLAVIAMRAAGLSRGLGRTGSTSEIAMEEQVASACVDGRRHCRHWADSGYCRTHAEFMQRECCRSCGGGGGRCVDDVGEHCGYWAQAGHCQSKSDFADFMRSNCCQSCGYGDPPKDTPAHGGGSGAHGHTTSDRTIAMATDEERDELLGTRHIRLKNPVAWEIERVPREGADGWVCVETHEPLRSGIYPREDAMGDPEATGRDSIRVEVLDRGGRVKRTLKFRTEYDIELPPDVHGRFTDRDITEPLDIITLLLREGETCRVKA